MKSWALSKTIIINSLSLAAGLLTVAAGSELVAQYPRAAALVGSSLAAVNIGLRFVTYMPIG
jgi:hypothetical protein